MELYIIIKDIKNIEYVLPKEMWMYRRSEMYKRLTTWRIYFYDGIEL